MNKVKNLEITDVIHETKLTVGDNYDLEGMCPVYIDIEGFAVGLTSSQATQLSNKINEILRLEKYQTRH